MKSIQKILLMCLLAFAAIACNTEPSLQKYYVEKQNDANFIVIDVPASLFLGSNSTLSEEQQTALKSIEKANVLAFPISGDNQEIFEKEKENVDQIFTQKKYKLLFRMGSVAKGVRLMYLGEEDAIDEFILYGVHNEKGFAVARILGDDMNPGAIMKLMKSAGEGDIDVNMSAFDQLDDILEDKDSVQ
ncbi:DUF4252 domain-containing protein [Mesonia aquimarina]|uniref:DUF4252 domain-containing protein n=1 Tax=Mesonia aquimarina TaxID=1504967 RepID=UPI000EF5F0CC|nr:DUF4252 domain-containing protein [Mesonia aquimarina]